jgi:hypothetical protein
MMIGWLFHLHLFRVFILSRFRDIFRAGVKLRPTARTSARFPFFPLKSILPLRFYRAHFTWQERRRLRGPCSDWSHISTFRR